MSKVFSYYFEPSINKNARSSMDDTLNFYVNYVEGSKHPKKISLSPYDVLADINSCDFPNITLDSVGGIQIDEKSNSFCFGSLEAGILPVWWGKVSLDDLRSEYPQISDLMLQILDKDGIVKEVGEISGTKYYDVSAVQRLRDCEYLDFVPKQELIDAGFNDNLFKLVFDSPKYVHTVKSSKDSLYDLRAFVGMNLSISPERKVNICL